MTIFTSIKRSLSITAPQNALSGVNAQKALAEARQDFVKTINESVARRKEFYMTKAKLENVGIVHIFDKEFPKGGMTIAFKKSNPYKSGVMVDVAVNNCSSEDTFSRSHGTVGALEKFFEGKVIQVPLLRFYEERDLPTLIKNHFSRMYMPVF